MISKNLRALREDSDITQTALAKILGVAQNTYSQYENGIIDLTDDIIIKLADFYGTSTDYILDQTNVKKPYPRK